MVRYVLKLPKQANEFDFKVESLVGKTVKLDMGNNYFFGGQIKEEVIEGWGFPPLRLERAWADGGHLAGH